MLFFTLFLCNLSTAFGQTGTEGFYKDLFIDGGVHLAAAGQLEADSLGLSYEHIQTEDSVYQNLAMVKNYQDDNGALLYPDGSPRFRLLYTNGGYGNHGRTLTSVGRRQIRHFFNEGGSYAGSCNGAALAGTGQENYNLWTGPTVGTDIGNPNSSTPTSHYLPQNSVVHNYGNFPGQMHNILHSGGYYFPSPGPNTEVLSTYKGAYTDNHGNQKWLEGLPSVVAYKLNSSGGRLVISGSHPEYAPVAVEEQHDLMEAFFQYALDGLGTPSLKATLTNGNPHHVDETSNNFQWADYSNYSRIKIGDKQYHHFKMQVNSSPYIMLELDGTAGYHLNLYARRGTEKVFASNATYSATTAQADQVLLIPNPGSGEWHFSVECATSVTATWDALAGTYVYTEEVPGVLNGVAYSIEATMLATPPAVSFSGLAASYCINDAPATLNGQPAGGTFSGPGIVGDTFNPALAGFGTHSITYTWGTASHSQNVTVAPGSGPAPIITGPSHVDLGPSLVYTFMADGHPDVEDYDWSFLNVGSFYLVSYVFDAQGRKIGVQAGHPCGTKPDTKGGDGLLAPPVQNVTIHCTANYCGGTQVAGSHTATYAYVQTIVDPCIFSASEKMSGLESVDVSLFPNPAESRFFLQASKPFGTSGLVTKLVGMTETDTSSLLAYKSRRN
ncbi:MAG: hypothetical protein AAF570_06340, partial [Bacteroidota bacterium]